VGDHQRWNLLESGEHGWPVGQRVALLLVVHLLGRLMMMRVAVTPWRRLLNLLRGPTAG